MNMYKLIVVLLLVVVAALPAAAATRNCTAAEKKEANQTLLDIQNSNKFKQDLLDYHMPYGEHETLGDSLNEKLLFQSGYIMSHDEDLKTSLWVSYKLTVDDMAGAGGKDRVNCFRRDPRLEKSTGANPTDYKEPIFDQSHMANDADLKDDLIGQLNSYVMSNMSPQYCRFNRGIWLSLEHLTRAWAKQVRKYLRNQWGFF